MKKPKVTTKSELARLKRYDDLLTKVMPPDYKDWHENSKEEWPIVAAITIYNLRVREEASFGGYDTLQALAAKRSIDLTLAEAEIRRLKEKIRRITK